ncbi:MAG: hypothetical protein KAU12_03500 [Candidatus Omnitrophica bacterium]|nr:hypothetical protein [Candidatus Omnitrophota bacterium]
MKRNFMLVQKGEIGNIQRCACGAVHMRILSNSVSLHFTEDVFLIFASMVKRASFRLMDEHLADLVRDRDVEKEE